MYDLYKYQLNSYGDTTLYLPEGAEILDVQMQHGNIVLWSLQRQNVAQTPRKFTVHTTGGTCPHAHPGKHLATIQLNGGSFVVHIFEKV